MAVVGCGPAGMSLASELGMQGLSVGLIGKHSPFVNNYGVWPDEFKGKQKDNEKETQWNFHGRTLIPRIRLTDVLIVPKGL